ncbi:MAG: POTRA domain-containing protein, partial [Opitutales bacterium]
MKRIRILFAGLLLLALPADARGAYELDVEGFGWRQERRMERLLRDILRDTGDEGLTSFSQAKAEDAVLLLGSELSRRGFLEPTITFVLEGEGEELARVRMDPNADLRDLPWGRGDRVVFRVERGERAFFETIRIDGLTVMAEDAAKEFFAAPAGLLTTEGERAYSPASLDNGMASLRRRLAQLGRPEATVSLAEPPQIAPSGEVSVHLTVDEGPPFVWGAGRLEGVAEVVAAETEPLPAAPAPGTVFNEESVDDWALAVRNRHYAAGYPDVRIGRERRPEPSLDSPEVRMVVALSVEPGPRVRLGEVEVRGLEKTQPGLVRRVAGLETGDWLNPLELEQARFALGRLGVFEDIAVSTVAKPEAAAEGPVRDLVLRLEERSRRDFSLLFGYGSF